MLPPLGASQLLPQGRVATVSSAMPPTYAAPQVSLSASMHGEPTASGQQVGLVTGATNVRTTTYMTRPPTTGSVVMSSGMASAVPQPVAAASLFDVMDRNHDGVISRQEFNNVVR